KTFPHSVSTKAARASSKCSMRSEPITSRWLLTTRRWLITSSVSGNWNRPPAAGYASGPTLPNAEHIRRPMEAPTTTPQRSKIWPIIGLIVAFVLAIVIWQRFMSPTPKAADRTTADKAGSDKNPVDTIAVNEQQLKQVSTDMVKQQLVAVDRKA